MQILNSIDVWVIAGVVLAFLMIVGLMAWRRISEEELTTPPVKLPDQSVEERFAEFEGRSSPRYEDLVPGEFTKGSFSTQLQTDMFNIRIESVKGQTRYVVNGVAYNRLEEIPRGEIRRLAKRLYDKTYQGPYAERGDTEELRQVVIGNQATIESKSPSANVSVQRQGRQTRYIVNGRTYYKLNEIIDPEMRRIAKELMSKMV
jgi:hypothetical protein